MCKYITETYLPHEARWPVRGWCNSQTSPRTEDIYSKEIIVLNSSKINLGKLNELSKRTGQICYI